MLSRFCLTFFLLICSNKVLGAEGQGGMPQLNPESFSSQIFWLFVSFSVLFLIVHFFLLPKLKIVRKKREETVNNYISQTQKLNEQIDVIITQIDQELNKAKISFNNKIKEELEKNKIIFEKEVSLIEKNFETKIGEKKSFLQKRCLKNALNELVRISACFSNETLNFKFTAKKAKM